MLTLSAYSYTITYNPGGDHINADVLSRLPLPETPSDVPLPGETVLLLDILHGPVIAFQIKHWTDRDPLLSLVKNCVLQGPRWVHSMGKPSSHSPSRTCSSDEGTT